MAQGLWSLFSLQLPEFLFFFFLLPHPNLFKKQTPLPLNNNFTVSIASSLWSLISNKSWMGYSQGPVSMHLSKFGSHLPLWSFLEPPDLELNSAEIIKTTYGFSWAESDRAHPSKNSQTTRARKKGRTGEYIWAAAAAAAKSLRLCPTLCDPIDGSPPGSPVLGILQARTLEWVAISFSSAWKWKVKVKSLSRVQPSATPWTAAFQAPPSRGFPGKSTAVGCHCLLHIWATPVLLVLGEPAC